MPGLNQSVVVGMDFLLREKAVIDFYRHVVHLGKDNRITVAILNHEVEQEDATELPSTGFSVENQEETQELLRHFRHVNSTSGVGIGTCSIKHSMNVKNPRPFRQVSYRHNEEKRVEIERQVQEMLAEGINETSDLPYSSQIVMAKKKGGICRLSQTQRYD
ncbi:hypothetical protein TKK_0005008 [Trichogramma kaykai]